MEETEIWKDIPGYEGLYQVSNLGRVKSLSRLSLMRGKHPFTTKEKIKKSVVEPHGYSVCGLYLNGKGRQFKISVLVAMAFLGHVPDGTHKIVVDHINNVKTDNRLVNLQLITARENIVRSFKNSESPYTGVTKIGYKWRARIQINDKEVLLGASFCEVEASEMYQKALKNLHLYEGCPKTFREKLKNL